MKLKNWNIIKRNIEWNKNIYIMVLILKLILGCDNKRWTISKIPFSTAICKGVLLNS